VVFTCMIRQGAGKGVCRFRQIFVARIMLTPSVNFALWYGKLSFLELRGTVAWLERTSCVA
jgi:hypothetical protein